MQNKGQQLRTTSSTKNEFKHRESHQGTKNNTIHKDRITNQRPKPIRRRKTINEQKRKNEQTTRTATKNSKTKSKTKNKETGTSSTQQNQRTQDNNNFTTEQRTKAKNNIKNNECIDALRKSSRNKRQ